MQSIEQPILQSDDAVNSTSGTVQVTSPARSVIQHVAGKFGYALQTAAREAYTRNKRQFLPDAPDTGKEAGQTDVSAHHFPLIPPQELTPESAAVAISHIPPFFPLSHDPLLCVQLFVYLFAVLLSSYFVVQDRYLSDGEGSATTARGTYCGSRGRVQANDDTAAAAAQAIVCRSLSA